MRVICSLCCFPLTPLSQFKEYCVLSYPAGQVPNIYRYGSNRCYRVLFRNLPFTHDYYMEPAIGSALTPSTHTVESRCDTRPL